MHIYTLEKVICDALLRVFVFEVDLRYSYQTYRRVYILLYNLRILIHGIYSIFFSGTKMPFFFVKLREKENIHLIDKLMINLKFMKVEEIFFAKT